MDDLLSGVPALITSPVECVLCLVSWQSSMRNIKLAWRQMAADQGVKGKKKNHLNRRKLRNTSRNIG
jgi:hypothetical protein